MTAWLGLALLSSLRRMKKKMAFSNNARVRTELLALARSQEQPKPQFESWADVPLELRLSILETIAEAIEETMRSQMKSFRARIDFGTTINTVIVSARNSEEAFFEAKRVLGLGDKDVDGTVTPQ